MKHNSKVRKIAFVGDHLPRKCGIVGSKEARLRAGHGPPLKVHVRFSRMQLSRRLKRSEMREKELISPG